MASAPLDGLRERKKARTRASIREHALRLFREQGYQATTVEQIAEAAEVSQSTFFRYFPTKEDVVLRDDFELRIFEAFERQPPQLSPIAAIRAAVREVLARRVGRAPDDLAVQAIAGAVFGIIITVTLPWSNLTQDQAEANSFRRVDEA